VGVADSAKCNFVDMGMFFINKMGMKASNVFPSGMSKLVCVDFTCKGRDCIKDNCTFVHLRNVNNLKKDTILAIAKHFHKKKIGWFNKWYLLKVMGDLPDHAKTLLGGKDGPSSKTD
jgi:hypothetical protein